MRSTLFVAAALVASLSLASAAWAGDVVGGGVTDYTMGGCDSCGGNACGGHGRLLHGKHCRTGCGHCGHRKNYEGLDMMYNCGCQGSYNYPVPPQYTYHWPGSTYKQNLMSDYHSPWRFPPLKPYTEETLTPQGVGHQNEESLRPIAAYEELHAPLTKPGQVEAMSSMMERFFK